MRYAAIAVLFLLLIGGTAALLHAQRAADDGCVVAPLPRETRPVSAPVLQGCPPTEAIASPEASEALEEFEEFEEVECELLDEEDLPPDPIEAGPCTLELSFVDTNTGEAAPTSFDLWRLDAPGNADWTRGDQRQVATYRSEETARLEGLPEGRYRLHVHGAPKDATDADDPDSFVVAGSLTSLEISFRAPPISHVRVLVFDEGGHALKEARKRVGGSGSYSSDPSTPEWVRSRTLTGDRYQGSSSFGMGCGSGRGRGAPIDIRADAAGFDLGAWRAASRYRSKSVSLTLLFEGRSSVYEFVATKELPRRPLVALSLPLDWIRSRTRLSDGTWIEDTDLALEAECAPVEPAENADPWTVASALPIKIRAKRGKDTVAQGVLHLADEEVVLE